MKLEHQACSLELAKRLRELGVKQESLWYWGRNAKYGDLIYRGWPPKEDEEENGILPLSSAFTTAELGEMLPTKITKGPDDFYLMIWKNGAEDLWSVGYRTPKYHIELQEFDGNEADARAKCLAYLIENKLITP